MDSLSFYQDRFSRIKIRREDGILELRLHTDDGALRWGPVVHEELGLAFRAVARDPSNRVMILTGTGDAFCGEVADVSPDFRAMPPARWEVIFAHGMELIDSLLSVPVPVIAAVNGPAVRHCELPLMSDIVICSEDAEFQDLPHLPGDLTPGDGINVVTALIMGLTRSRYFHLTGQVIGAPQALEWGMVNEVVERSGLMDRAWQLARHKPMVLRHTRMLFTVELRQRMLGQLGFGLALEGLDAADAADAHGRPDGDAQPTADGLPATG